MIIKSILKIQAGEATFTDDYDANVIPPGITYGVYTELIFDLRSAAIQDSRVLPPYELPEADSYYIAIDSDWLQETAPKLLRTSGIRVEQTEEQTLLFIPLPNTHKATGLADAIEASATKTLTLNCEIGGIKEGQQGDAFAFNFPLVIRNRIWLPGESTEPDPSDPDYLNTAQVQAFINAAIATALEDIQGDPGPAPVISIGEVSIGETAGVIVNEIAPGEYSIDFVFPEGEQGPKGSIAGLALGTITDGTEAEASINLVGETYILDLVLPRGKDGINPKGNWLDTELYNLNDAVRHNKVFWRSLIDDNLDNEPPSNRKDNQYWQVIVKDGKDAERLLRSYNTTDDISDSNWHSELQAGDLYFRDSIDGGLTWTIPVKISVAHDVIELYNIDNTTDWQNIQVHSNYSTGFGKFMRARRVGGEWGQAYPIHDLDSQSLRIQFAASSIEPDWHNELSSGDTIARFYNTTGTINQIIVFSDGTFDVDLIQLCTIPNPWHKIYDIDFDRYRKISVDGGLTWTDPMPLYGKSAYESWLSAGNSGTEEDFVESMKGDGPGASLSDANPTALSDTASAGTSSEAARADHVHPNTGLAKSTELLNYLPVTSRGAINGVAALGADGKVPAGQLPEMSGGGDGAALPEVTSEDNGKVLGVVDGAWAKTTMPGGSGVSKQILACPYFDETVHLVFKVAVSDDFSDDVLLVDTADNVGLERVSAFNGSVFVPVTNAGLSPIFSGQAVKIDMTGYTNVNLLYKWCSADGDSDWYAGFFPSSGEAYVARPGTGGTGGDNGDDGGDIPEPVDKGQLQVNILGSEDGKWSINNGVTWYDSGQLLNLEVGDYMIIYKVADGFETPAAQLVSITKDQKTTINTTYVSSYGALKVVLSNLDGRWSVDNGNTWHESGVSLQLLADSYLITFKDIEDFVTPSDQFVAVTAGGELTQASGLYVSIYDTLAVTLNNPDGRWSIDDGETWHESLASIPLEAGDYTVIFKAVEGYTTPEPQQIVIAGGQVVYVTGTYVSIFGNLKVTLNNPDGRWSVDNGDTWHESGASVLLLAGDYTVTFKEIENYDAPNPQSVTVVVETVKSISAQYVVSRDPNKYGMVWDNGDEPTLEGGQKIIFVSPAGAGNKSGDSWENAKGGIYAAMLVANDGDVLYLQEGNYTNHLAPIENKSIKIYGGFSLAEGTWETRNGWRNETVIDPSSNRNISFVKAASNKVIDVDGICFKNFTAGVMIDNGGDGSVKNCMFENTQGTVSDFGVNNCLLFECNGGFLVNGNAINSIFSSCETNGVTGSPDDIKTIAIVKGEAEFCKFLECASETKNPYNCVYIIKGNASNSVFTNCRNSQAVYGTFSNSSFFISGNASECTFTNCNNSNSGYYQMITNNFIGGDVTKCGFIDCINESNTRDATGTNNFINGDVTESDFTGCKSQSNNNTIDVNFISGNASECTFADCTGSNGDFISGNASECTFADCIGSNGDFISGNASECTFADCIGSNGDFISGNASECTFADCRSYKTFGSFINGDISDCVFTNSQNAGSSGHFIHRIAVNCLFQNCSATYFSSSEVMGNFCTFIRCKGALRELCSISNSVVFQHGSTVSFGGGTNNAASAYIDGGTITLGIDNAFANFADLGTVSIVGADDRLKGLSLSDFGDFRPQAGSVLIGAGVAVQDITEDLDGNERQDPPTIGAYEYVVEEE